MKLKLGPFCSICNGLLHGIKLPSTPPPQLTVVVQDVNDNAPVFTSPQVTRIVDEGEELSTELVTVQASDVDAGLNGMILYSLEDDFGKQLANSLSYFRQRCCLLLFVVI